MEAVALPAYTQQTLYILRCHHRHITGPRQTDREQGRLAEKSDPKYMFTFPRAILPKPSICDKITVMKLLVRDQLTWIAHNLPKHTGTLPCRLPAPLTNKPRGWGQREHTIQ